MTVEVAAVEQLDCNLEIVFVEEPETTGSIAQRPGGRLARRQRTPPSRRDPEALTSETENRHEWAALVPAIHDFLDWGEAHVESQSRAGHPGFRVVWESGFADRRERARRWLSANADRISETLLDGNA